ncbi:hypothetical protein A2U01_0034052, partial [Trifolium medium]|nr:hypothetical protein [Trifolium medium]
MVVVKGVDDGLIDDRNGWSGGKSGQMVIEW